MREREKEREKERGGGRGAGGMTRCNMCKVSIKMFFYPYLQGLPEEG
jgi:hypothetical protein